MWSGNLRLSLVSCPIALYGAVNHRRDISFHLINPDTNNRIKMVPTDPDTGPVNRADLVKGYEFEKDRYVIVTPDELEAVRQETTSNLDIESFVDASDIDRLFWDEPYFLLPGDDNAIQAYSVVREALARTNRIALGRVVMHTRERLLALEPSGKGILAYTLRMRDEVIDPATVFGGISDQKIDARMVDIAEKIISQSKAPFDTATFRDRYEEALRELVKRKQQGESIEAPRPEQPSNVIDLMEALRRSLKAKPAEAVKPAHKTAPSKVKGRSRKKAS
ncbi:Ku protein [Rhizomicrobium palustre]|uniref:non-homologous end joining protein Ku n=1 Tax=Rhizomicrobium palustre TaxID=189966 RepID=UPI0031CFA069